MKITLSGVMLIVFITAISCNSNKTKEKGDTKTDTTYLVITEEKEEPPPPPPPPPPSSIGLKPAVEISARMVYDDGSLSSFDVLQDSTKALWNVIIGGGDAEKPSGKTRLVIKSPVDSIDILVTQGKRVAYNKKKITISDSLVITLKDTGCDKIVVDIRQDKIKLYKKAIEYHCGE